MNFAQRCGLDNPARQAAVAQCIRVMQASGIEQVRFAWCDLHGKLRGKTLMLGAAVKALSDGVGLVSTLLLKDTSDHTCWPVFEADGAADLPGFANASNLVLLPDLATYKQLPWAHNTAWLLCQPWYQNGLAVSLDGRRVLQKALQKLSERGLGMVCGLEVELHIYKIKGHADAHADANPNATALPDPSDPNQAAWPGLSPQVELIHPGYKLLSEELTDRCAEPFRILQTTAQALGLPLMSLEVELGPSQVEAVFEATDALTAADNMVLFRSAATQALRRAGYHATFMCRPPFANVMSSGWHLHQSLVQLDRSHQSLVQLDRSHQSPVEIENGDNAFMRPAPADTANAQDARFSLSDLGCHYLAGLLAHAPAMAALAVPTLNGFERFSANRLAPNAINWGCDNRGALLRVIGGAGDAATRIENRLGEPAANPYLYMASQIYAGLDGMDRALAPPPACTAPYDGNSPRLPATLNEALKALQNDAALSVGLGLDFVNYYTHIKKAEIDRYALAQDKLDWQRREYFA